MAETRIIDAAADLAGVLAWARERAGQPVRIMRLRS